MSDPDLGTPRPHSRRRRLSGWLLIAGGLTNCAFLLAPVIGVGLDPLLTFVSELSATGQPNGTVFAASDLVTGLLLASGIVAGWNQVAPIRSLRVAQLAVLSFAICTAADAFLPLDCVASIDPTCRAAEASGSVSLRHAIHSVTGVVESAAIITTSFAVAAGTWRLRRWAVASRLVLAAGIAQAAVSLGIALMYLTTNIGVGLLQRMSVLLFSATVGAVGWAMVSRPALLRNARGGQQ